MEFFFSFSTARAVPVLYFTFADFAPKFNKKLVLILTLHFFKRTYILQTQHDILMCSSFPSNIAEHMLAAFI